MRTAACWVGAIVCAACFASLLATEPSTKENLAIPSCLSAAGERPACSVEPMDSGPLGVAAGSEACVIVLDGGRSMLESGALERARASIAVWIDSLPDGFELSLIVFDRGVHCFPASGRPARASAATRRSAAAWLASQGSGCGTSALPAFLRALELARRSGARDVCIRYFGDGLVLEPREARRLLDAARASADSPAPIHCHAALGRDGGDVLRALSAATGGCFSAAEGPLAACAGAPARAAAGGVDEASPGRVDMKGAQAFPDGGRPTSAPR